MFLICRCFYQGGLNPPPYPGRNPVIYLSAVGFIENFMSAAGIQPQGHIDMAGLFKQFLYFAGAFPVVSHRIISAGKNEQRKCFGNSPKGLQFIGQPVKGKLIPPSSSSLYWAR